MINKKLLKKTFDKSIKDIATEIYKQYNERYWERVNNFYQKETLEIIKSNSKNIKIRHK